MEIKSARSELFNELKVYVCELSTDMSKCMWKPNENKKQNKNA